MKKQFLKNLFQSITFFSVIFLLDILLLWGFIESLKYKPNNGWILLAIAFFLLAMFLFVGFYWIFQTVEINDRGIKIRFFSKCIKIIVWKNVEKIEYGTVMRNPAYIITLKDKTKLNLDARKQIGLLLNTYSKKHPFIFQDKH